MRLTGFRYSRRLYAVLAAALLLLTGAPAIAGSSDMGSISGVLPHYAGLFFNQSGARNSAPACATVTQRWVINVGTPQGQAMAAALLSAYMAHKRVTVIGTHNCDIWADTETAAYFVIED